MIKVICVVDKTGTALDRLAKQVAQYHTNIEYVVCDVHPKKPDTEQLQRFEQEAIDADVIDYQYFRTAVMLRERYAWLKDKRSILTHNNAYSYKEDKWGWADVNVGNNNEIFEGLKAQGTNNVEHIPITCDPYFWKFNREWQPTKTVIMVANRIESKKGILPVATAVGNLDMRFVLVGAVSDPKYLYDIMQTGNVEFHEQVSDEKLRELYHGSVLHVCNSVDGFESGTMPILEAMLCGTPVMTRNIGHVPDLNNEHNVFIYEGENDDVMAIQDRIEDIINDKKQLEEYRQDAWNTAKNFNPERRAYLYQKLYMPDCVSIILPICGKPDILRKNLEAIAEQTHQNIELIVVDDGESQEDIVRQYAKTVSFAVRYIPNNQNDYGLARARNKGIIEAIGDILIFVDQRMVMDRDCVAELIANVAPRKWVYGNKGGKKDFVENLSAIHKEDIVRAGMFCERIDKYGGMSQEVRTRTRQQGITHEYVESAKATPTGRSKNKYDKRDEIVEMKNRLFKMGLN